VIGFALNFHQGAAGKRYSEHKQHRTDRALTPIGFLFLMVVDAVHVCHLCAPAQSGPS